MPVRAEGTTITTGIDFSSGTLVPLLKERCGYDSALIRTDFLVIGTVASFSVPVAAFSAEPLDAGSACVAVLDVPGSQSAKPEVERVRESGAPVVLACRPGRLEWWRQGTGSDTTTILTTIAAEKVPAFLAEIGTRLAPRVVTRAKTIARVERSYQLDFVDFGLMPLLEAQAGEKLTELVESMLVDLQAACGSVADDKQLFKWVFRLLAGKLLHDKKVPAFASVDLEDPQEVFRAVAAHLGVTPEPILGPESVPAALTAAARRLVGFTPLTHVTTRSLAHLYETGLLNKDKRHNNFRKKWGIHNTPWWLADYLVWKVRDWVAQWPLAQRRVFDPGCGAATLLVSAVGLLRDLAEDEGLSPARIRQHLRDSIEGFDKDAFGLEIARLSLTLANLPHHNGWQLGPGDIFSLDQLNERLSRCPIVVANPPFEDFTSGDRQQYRGLTQTNKAAELVARLVNGLPSNGVLSLVLPQGFLHAPQSEATRRILLEQFEVREITLFPDKVFNFSDAEACVLLCRRKVVPASTPVRFRWVREPDVRRFENDYGVTAEQFTTPARFLRNVKAILRIPQFDEVWECCREMARFSDIAQIGTGFQHNTSKQVPPGTVLVSNNPFPDAVAAFVNLQGAGDVGLHASPREVWVNISAEVLERSRMGTVTGVPQVVLNFMRVSRGPWRLKAFLDPAGHALTTQFIAVRPKKKTLSLEVLWAVCNSSFANAFAYAHSMKRQVLPGTLRQMPFPAISQAEGDRLAALVRDYIAATGHAALDEGLPLFTDPGATGPSDLDRLLKRIDAEVLRLYRLPPRFERRILDAFDALAERTRPGVPFPWSRYYPEWLTGPASYYHFHAEEGGAIPAHPEPLPAHRFIQVIEDNTLPDGDRAAMLLDLVRSGAPEAPDVVAGLLAQNPPESAEWMKAVLAAAEQVRFVGVEEQQKVRSRLFDWAVAARDRSESQLKPAVKSAVRRFATLVPVGQVGQMANFLRPQDRELSWLIALLGIQNVFAESPPSGEVDLRGLSAGVLAVADEVVKRRQFEPGEESNLTVDAVQTLIALAAPEAVNVAAEVAKTAPEWLRTVLAEGVTAMSEKWRDAGVSERNPAMERAKACLSVLRGSFPSP